MFDRYFAIVKDIEQIKDGTNNDYLTYLADIYNSLLYRTIQGQYAKYSLNDIDFFPSLEKAQAQFSRYHNLEYDEVLHKYLPNYAIIELEIGFSGKVDKILNIYEVKFNIETITLADFSQQAVFQVAYELSSPEITDCNSRNIRIIDHAYSLHYKTFKGTKLTHP